MRRHSPIPASSPRRGSVLLLVLVVVAALAFSVFSFSERSLGEYEATRASVDQIQMRTAAASGVEAARGWLEAGATSRTLTETGLVGDRDGRRVTYALWKQPPSVTDTPAAGLANESARFNPNALSLKPSRLRESRERLLALPGMTPDLAGGILAWMAAPDVAEAAAEDEAVDEPPHRRFERIDELLLVPGMTPDRLYGTGSRATGPNAMANRVALAEFLTVSGHESNVSPNGLPKVHLNRKDLAGLYDDLRGRLGFPEATALFLVAVRTAPLEYDHEGRPPAGDAETERLKRLDSARRRLERQLGGSKESASVSVTRTAREEARGGLALPPEPPIRIDSLAQLAGAKVRVRIHDEDRLLTSPWRDDAQGFENLLTQLEPWLTTSSGSRLEGRVRLQEAPVAVLRTIPGMSESLARAIVARRRPGSRDQETIAWLLREGLVTAPELRELAPYLTTGGSAWRGVAVGRIEGNQSVAAIQFQVAHSGRTTTILGQFDLPFAPAPTSFPGSTGVGIPTSPRGPSHAFSSTKASPR